MVKVRYLWPDTSGQESYTIYSLINDFTFATQMTYADTFHQHS